MPHLLPAARRRLLAAAALVVPTALLIGTAPAAAVVPATPPPLTGSIVGADGRAVNALIGVDFLDPQGRKLDKNGCPRSTRCPVPTYTGIAHVNKTTTVHGTTDRRAARAWSLPVPRGAVQAFVEVYPKSPSGVTQEVRYGHAMRHSVPLPSRARLPLTLPLVRCDQGGTVGRIRGTAVTAGGRPVPVTRVIAWSQSRYDPLLRPVIGWNIGTARLDGTFVVPNLPPQRYQVWLTARDGRVRKTFQVPVKRCAPTSLKVVF